MSSFIRISVSDAGFGWYFNLVLILIFWKLTHTESGRHVISKKFTKIFRVVCSDGSDLQQKGKCVVAYKLTNEKELDIRNIQDVSDLEQSQINVVSCI